MLGAFAAYGAERAHDLRDRPAVRNTALTDTARTSEARGAATRAVEAVFSYDFADPEALDRAVAAHLTGGAVGQHAALLAPVREQGPRQRLVLTTTVTDSGVERVEGTVPGCWSTPTRAAPAPPPGAPRATRGRPGPAPGARHRRTRPPTPRRCSPSTW
ncbi:hypothetical protein ACRAR1_02795 [Streptomyces sanyensis]|uniref:hypothetical protein n=1 Tax=Streptomyces sanyensis TaxID=568869 RepID=UPI003D787A1D